MDQPTKPEHVYECPKCKAHDLETKELMGKLFGQDEQIAIAMMLAQNIGAVRKKLMQATPNNHLRFQNHANMDFMCAVISKFFMGLNDKNLKALQKFIKQAGGFEFNVLHESCPHKENQHQESADDKPQENN